MSTRILLSDRIDGLEIVRFSQDQDLEPVDGILESADVRHEVPNDLGFPEYRDQHRVARQLVVGYRPRLCVGDDLRDIAACGPDEQVTR